MTRRDYSETDAFMVKAGETWMAMGMSNSYSHAQEFATLRRAHIALAPKDGPNVALVTAKTIADVRRVFELQDQGYSVTVEPIPGVLSGFTKPVATRTVPNMETEPQVLLRLLMDKTARKEVVIPSHLVPEASEIVTTLNQAAEQLLDRVQIARLLMAAGFKGRIQEPWGFGEANARQVAQDILFHHKPSKQELEDILVHTNARIVNAQAALARAPWFRGLSGCGRILLGDGATCNIIEADVSGYSNTWEHLGKALGAVARHGYREAALRIDSGDHGGGHGGIDGHLRLVGLSVTGLLGRSGADAHALKTLRRDVTLDAWAMADKLGLARPKAVLAADNIWLPDNYLELNASAVSHHAPINTPTWMDGGMPSVAAWMHKNWGSYIAFNR